MKHRARRRVEHEAGAILARDQQSSAAPVEFENREPGGRVRHSERADFLQRTGGAQRDRQRARRGPFPFRHDRLEAAVGIGHPGMWCAGELEIGTQDKLAPAEQEDGVVAEFGRHLQGGGLAGGHEAARDRAGARIMARGVDLIEQRAAPGFPLRALRLLGTHAQRMLAARLLLPDPGHSQRRQRQHGHRAGDPFQGAHPPLHAAHLPHRPAAGDDGHIREHLARGMVAPHGVALTRAQDDLIQLQPLLKVVGLRPVRRQAREFRAVHAGERFIQNFAEREDVRAFRTRPLQRHEALRADKAARTPRLRHQSDVAELRHSAGVENVRRLHVAVNETLLVQKRERAGQRLRNAEALGYIQGFAFANPRGQRGGDVGGMGRIRLMSPIGPVRQFHHIVKPPRVVIPPHVENVYESVVRPAHRLAAANAFKLTQIGPLAVERRAAHDLHGAQRAHHIPRQPHLAITPAPDDAQQRVIGNGEDFGAAGHGGNRSAALPSGEEQTRAGSRHARYGTSR